MAGKAGKGIRGEGGGEDKDILSESKARVSELCQEEGKAEEGDKEGAEANDPVCQKESGTGKRVNGEIGEERRSDRAEGTAEA